jgi:hypothetical protein
MYPACLNNLPTTQRSRACREHGISAQAVGTLKKVTPKGVTCKKYDIATHNC